MVQGVNNGHFLAQSFLSYTAVIGGASNPSGGREGGGRLVVARVTAGACDFGIVAVFLAARLVLKAAGVGITIGAAELLSLRLFGILAAAGFSFTLPTSCIPSNATGAKGLIELTFGSSFACNGCVSL